MKFETAVNKIEAGLGGGVNDEQGIAALFEQHDTLSDSQIVAEAGGGGYVPNTNYLSWQNTETNGVAHLFTSINNTKGRFWGWGEAEQALRNQLPPPKFDRYRGNYVVVFADGKNLINKLQAIAVQAEGTPLPMCPQMRYTTFRATSPTDEYNHVYAMYGEDNVSFIPTLEDDSGAQHEIDPYGAFASMLCKMIQEAESGRSWNPQEIIDLDTEIYIDYLSEDKRFKSLKEGFYQSVHESAMEGGTAATSGTPAMPDDTIEKVANKINAATSGAQLANILASCPKSYITTGLDRRVTFTSGGRRERRAQLNTSTLAYPQNYQYTINTFFEMVHRLKSSDENFKIEDRIGYIPANEANTEYLTRLYKQNNVLGMEYSGWNRQLQKFHKFMDGIKVADFNTMQA